MERLLDFEFEWVLPGHGGEVPRRLAGVHAPRDRAGGARDEGRSAVKPLSASTVGSGARG